MTCGSIRPDNGLISSGSLIICWFIGFEINGLMSESQIGTSQNQQKGILYVNIVVIMNTEQILVKKYT